LAIILAFLAINVGSFVKKEIDAGNQKVVIIQKEKQEVFKLHIN